MAISISVNISNISDGTQVDAADVTVALNDLKVHVENVLNGIQEADALRLSEITTPSNPAATKHKLYFKADGSMYTLNSAGNEVSIVYTGIDVVQYQCFT